MKSLGLLKIADICREQCLIVNSSRGTLIVRAETPRIRAKLLAVRLLRLAIVARITRCRPSRRAGPATPDGRGRRRVPRDRERSFEKLAGLSQLSKCPCGKSEKPQDLRNRRMVRTERALCHLQAAGPASTSGADVAPQELELTFELQGGAHVIVVRGEQS